MWSPEHLFVASLNTCFMLTFRDRGKFQAAAGQFLFDSQGQAGESAGSSYQITEIVVKPTVVIASANDLGRMPRILEKAKANCFVSNSIKCVIKIEPEVFHHQTQTSPCPLGEGPGSKRFVNRLLSHELFS